MRNHKCRGKRVDNGEWVKGYYCLTKFPWSAIPFNSPDREHATKCASLNKRKQWFAAIQDADNPNSILEVDPSTISRFVGLWDVDGVEIYEDDIVKGVAIQRQGGFEYLGKVVWYGFNTAIGWYVENTIGAWNLSQLQTRISLDNITGRVIGNIHEHPYLLKEASR